MKIISLILATMVLYLVREVTLTKHYGSTSSRKKLQTTNTERVNTSSHPQLLQWDSEVSPNGKYHATSYTGDYKDRFHYYQVFITDLYTDTMHRIFSGDFRTLGWQWTPDNRIKISYNCGTGCHATKIIDINKSVSMANLQYDEINEKNGWQVTFTKSF